MIKLVLRLPRAAKTPGRSSGRGRPARTVPPKAGVLRGAQPGASPGPAPAPDGDEQPGCQLCARSDRGLLSRVEKPFEIGLPRREGRWDRGELVIQRPKEEGGSSSHSPPQTQMTTRNRSEQHWACWGLPGNGAGGPLQMPPT